MRFIFSLFLSIFFCLNWAQAQTNQIFNEGIDSAQVAEWLNQAAAHVKTNADSLRYYAELALVGSRKANLPAQLGEAHWYMGRSFDLQDDSRQAVVEMERALELLENENAPLKKARVMLDLSQIYFDLGGQDQATKLLEKAMQMPEIGTDLDLASKLHHRAGSFYLSLGQPQKGLEQFKLALRDSKVVGKKNNIAAGHNNIGNAFSALMQFDSAYHYYKLSLPNKERNGDFRGMSQTLNNMGNVLIRQEKYSQGDSALDLSAKYALQGNFLELWLRIRLNQSYAKIMTGKAAEAVEILEELLEKTTPETDADLQIAIYGNIADAYSDLGRYKEALFSMEKHIVLKDSLSGITANASILELESRLETEAKEREIAILAERQEVQNVQLENRKIWIAVLISIAIIVLLVAILLFQRYRSKQDSHRQLEELTQLRSRFFANISHEFRTPLSLLIGPLQKYNSDPNRQPPDPELMLLMERNSRQLLDLNNQLLELSRLESGKMDLEAGRVDLVPFLNQLGQAFIPLAQERKIWLSIHVPESPGWWANVDRNALTRIVNNLLSNALKHTPENGEVRFRASLSDAHDRDLESGNPDRDQWPLPGRLAISISDTGKGIPKSEQNKIFDRFYRVKGSNQLVPGVGIGLALVKELVDLQDGNISVESAPGAGSKFSVSLPVLIGWETPSQEEVVDSIVEPDAEGELLLIVDDNAQLRQQLKDTLSESYRILEASDGQKALEVAFAEIPDLVLTDFMMPMMNGLELCKALREDERSSHIPVVLLSAEASPEQRFAGLETGADEYLVKPVHPSELQLRIRNLLAQRRRLREKWSAEQPASVEQGGEETTVENAFLQRAANSVGKFLDDPSFDVEQFAREMGLSRTQLFRKLKALTNQGPNEFVRNLRLQEASNLLAKGEQNVSEVLFSVGFSSPSYFSRCFKQQFGMSPKAFAEQNQ